jgi:TfoX/Sxy family transcriptional regulator of competence genes
MFSHALIEMESEQNMSSDEDFVKFLAEQMEDAGVIRYRKMFGDYAIYCDEKVIALVCDNKLFVKPTEAGRSFIGEVVEAPAYPGAKMSFLIEDKFEDREWISELIQITEKELPIPKPKRRK